MFGNPRGVPTIPLWVKYVFAIFRLKESVL